jgi:hypothetical protein
MGGTLVPIYPEIVGDDADFFWSVAFESKSGFLVVFSIGMFEAELPEV